MKTLNYSLLAVAACLMTFASCQKTVRNDFSCDSDTSRFPVTFDISSGSLKTKALNTKDDSVSTVQILVFNDTMIDAYGRNDKANLVTVSCTEGTRTVYAVVNGPDCSNVTSIDHLKSKTFSLGDNSCNKIVMIGSITKDLKPSTEPVTIEVKRLLARIVLKKITRDMTAGSLATIEFKLTGCYLTNVPGNNNLGDYDMPMIWYNSGGYKPDTDSKVLGLIYDKINGVKVENNGTYPTVHTFYTITNARSQNTLRLVIEATIGGKTCYYPIDIPQIAANQSYEISNLTIKRPGSDSPEKNVKFGDISFTVKVLDWDDSISVSELSI